MAADELNGNLPPIEPSRPGTIIASPRFEVPVDVHLILRRTGNHGAEVLLSRRAGDVYASGLLHLPSGHLDGPHEDAVAGVIREAKEETGVIIDRADVRAAVTVHHRSPAGGARIGFFFEVTRWQGTPSIRESHLCCEMPPPGPVTAAAYGGSRLPTVAPGISRSIRTTGSTAARWPGRSSTEERAPGRR
ncbi:NUDIX domain-containing protein [Streptomyces chattanoogensis]|uniref:NUDIX domain-containing protein n=1 Tax=Streptomyces chattanoogensis TaxID=66876 RepID=UPI003686DAD1